MQHHDAALTDQAGLTVFLDGLLADAKGLEGTMLVWQRLRAMLAAQHAVATPDTWRAICTHLRAHRFFRLVLEDPLTRHGVTKPRGYPGDAALLDFVLRLGDAPRLVREASAAGRDVNAVTTEMPLPVAVRERTRIMARTVDAAATRCRGRGVEVLALTGGHLREASIAHAPAEGAVHRWVSLDQDPQSADEAARSHAHLPCVVPICAPVGPLMTRPLLHGRFDLVYAASLFNYLDQPTAIGLLLAMLHALKPGGQALIVCPHTSFVDAAYLEAVQDWQAIQRDEAAMQDIVDALPAAELASTRIMRSTNGAMVYAQVTKRG